MASLLRTVSSLPGSRTSSCTSLSDSSGVSVSRTWPRYIARMNSAVSCDVNALVEATPISGPACVISVPAASRVIMEPTTLQMASVFEPFCLASRCAASVSAVSPDCEITTVSVFVGDDRIAIAELAAVIHFHRNARQLLDHELAGQRGVPAGAAGDDLDGLETRETPSG